MGSKVDANPVNYANPQLPLTTVHLSGETLEVPREWLETLAAVYRAALEYLDDDEEWTEHISDDTDPYSALERAVTMALEVEIGP